MSSNPEPVPEFELKLLAQDAIPAALERAERYRLLNEADQAESICLDILRVDPGNQTAIIQLLLALTEQFSDSIAGNIDRALALLPRLTDGYRKAYYRGLINERHARVCLRRASPGAGYTAYDLFRDAMEWYEKAEELGRLEMMKLSSGGIHAPEPSCPTALNRSPETTPP